MKKAKIFLSIISLSLLSTSLALFNQDSAINISAESEIIDVSYGDVIAVNKKTLTYLGQSKEVEGQIILPDGTAKKGKNFVVDNYGTYQVIYRAFFGVQEVSYIIQYKCIRTSRDLFTPTTPKTVNNGEYSFDNSIKGAVLTLANRNQVTFNQVLDFNYLDPTTPIIEFIVDPATQGEADISKFTVRLTDFDNSNNYVDIIIEDSTMVNDDGEGCYVLAGSNMQIKKGYEYIPEPKLHSNTFGDNTHSSFRALPIAKPNNKASLYFDYSTFGIYVSPTMHLNTKTMVTDLDDQVIYGSSLWKGFTNKKAILSIFPNEMISNSGNIVVTRIGDYDLSQINFEDNIAPTIDIDFNGQDEFNIPKAELNKPYPIFDAVVSDNYDLNLDYNVTVLYFDEDSTRVKDVSIINNTFTPTREGRYIVLYESSDHSSNKATRRINVFALNHVETLDLDLVEQTITGDIYSPISLPLESEVNVTGGSGKAVVERKLFNSQSQEISLTGSEFIPIVPDTYQAKYRAYDYLGNYVEKVITLDIKAPNKPVLTNNPVFAPILIKDHTYNLPIAQAVEYVNNQRKTLTPQIYVNDVLLDSNSFKVGDACNISYRFIGETGNLEFNKNINVVKPHLEGNLINQSEYFYGDFDAVSEDNLYVRLTANNKDASTLFANVLPYSNLLARLETTDGYDNYSKIYIKYFDRYNENLSLTFVIRKDEDKLYISTLAEPTEHEFHYRNIDGKSTFVVDFSNATGALYSIATSNNFIMNVNYFDDGSKFNGFSNGVYLKTSVEGVHGIFYLDVAQIANQNLGHRGLHKDRGVPVIILKNSVINEGKIGGIATTAVAEAFDVFSDVSLKLNVFDPNGDLILNNVDASVEQTFTFDNYGSYLLMYKAIDTANRQANYQTAINVYDDIKPTLEVNNNLSKTYSVGDKVEIPSYKASDNLGYYTVDVLLILPDYQERLLIKDNNGEVTSYLTSDANIYNSSFIYNKNTFILEQKGKYVLKFLCYDKDYNKVEVKIEFNAK